MGESRYCDVHFAHFAAGFVAVMSMRRKVNQQRVFERKNGISISIAERCQNTILLAKLETTPHRRVQKQRRPMSLNLKGLFWLNMMSVSIGYHLRYRDDDVIIIIIMPFRIMMKIMMTMMMTKPERTVSFSLP